jgi:hypothetical protein
MGIGLPLGVVVFSFVFVNIFPNVHRVAKHVPGPGVPWVYRPWENNTRRDQYDPATLGQDVQATIERIPNVKNHRKNHVN